jgi:hypothetical protein
LTLLLACGSLLILGVFSSDGATRAASVKVNGSDPALESLTLSGAGLVLSDTHPGGTTDRSVYVNNAQGGVLTLTFEISGTAPLTLTPGAAFGYTPTTVATSTAPMGWRPAITYPVPTTATPEIDTTYVITNGHQMTTAIRLTYTRDITLPTLAPGTPPVLTDDYKWISPTGATLFYTNSMTLDKIFRIQGSAGDALSGLGGVTATAALHTPNPTNSGSKEDWYFDYAIASGMTESGTITTTARDRVGNRGVLVFTYTLDDAPPVNGDVTINDGAHYATRPEVTLTLDAADLGSGVKEMCVANTPTCGGDRWTPFNAQQDHTLSSGDGVKTVYVWFRDYLGNSSDLYTDTINLDTKAPQDPTLTLADRTNGSQVGTDERTVAVTIGNEDADVKAWLLSEHQSTQPAEDDAAWSTTEPTNFTLSDGDGEKTVYVWVKDNAGNVNAGPVSATIILDRQPPTVTVSVPSQTAANPIPVQWEANDVAPPADGFTYTVRYREDNDDWQTWFENTTLTSSDFNSATLDHTYSFSVTTYDAAGNRGSGYDTVLFKKTYIFLPITLRNWSEWYAQDLNEPNDTRDQPGANIKLDPGEYEAYIWKPDDNDYYAFKSDAGGQVRIHLDLSIAGLHPDVDYDLYIYDSETGEIIAQSNYSNVPTEETTFSATAGKKYYIRVYPYRGYNNETPYHLTIEIVN